MNSNLTIKDLVKDTTAVFECYRDGDLWYSIVPANLYEEKNIDFQFPVPISDTGTGIFPRACKAITLMRWIRKHKEATEKYVRS